MRMVTVIEETDERLVVQINEKELIGTGAEGRTVVHVLKGRTVDEVIAKVYPDAERHTVDSLNEYVLNDLLQKGERVLRAGETPNDEPLVFTPEEAAKYDERKEQEAEAAQAAEEAARGVGEGSLDSE